SLHAVGAFFHHTAHADRNVRVVDHPRDGWLMLMEVQEVEVANLERTIVQAVSGADTSVVHHVVQPLWTVRGRRYRANVFARSVLALHTRHRLLYRPRLIFGADIVTVHAHPMHFPSAEHLIFADHRNIVFRLARDDARIAARAGGQIDRH